MIKNYLKTTLRIINRNKVFSLINIIGFSVGLISCLVIFLFVKHELSFDKHISDHQNIYRVVSEEAKNHKDAAVPFPLGDVVKKETTGTQIVSNIFFTDNISVSYDTKNYKENGIAFVDEDFVYMFDVEIISGNPSILNEPGMVLLTENLAQKYFGEINPVGKTITLNQTENFKIAGIVKSPSVNTHLPYKMLLSKKSLNNELVGFEYDNWNSRISGFSTYVKLGGAVTKENFEEQLISVLNKHTDLEEPTITTYYLQPMDEIHLNPAFESYKGTYTTSKKFIWIFISVGLFILVIASINFINLSTVQAIKRTREVGVRKVMGASRLKLIRQFMGETLILLIVAEILALITVEIILPHVSNLLGSDIQLNLYNDFSVFLFLLSILIFFGVIAGSYPALFLSRYKPIKALRSKGDLSPKKSLPVFGTLVVFQFFISQVLIIASVIASLQTNYFKNKDLGFNSENIIMINLYGQDKNNFGALRQEMLKMPEVDKVSFGIGAPMSNSNIQSNVVIPGKETEEFDATIKTVDEKYDDLFGLKLIAGRMFNRQSKGDTLQSIVVNKKLSEDMGYKDPANALGKTITCFGGKSEIVGVIDNFHTKSLHENLGRTILLYMPRFFITASVKLKNGYNSQSIEKLRQVYNKVYPQQFFDVHYLEETIKENYKNEDRTSKIIKIFAVVAIIIAILGLYGMVSFMLVHRTKEIGIRKTMGASVNSIIRLLSGTYLRYIFIAGILAWPIAYYLMKRWLEDFAYHISISWWYFLGATTFLLLISFSAIIFQTLKIANTNPVDSLRYE